MRRSGFRSLLLTVLLVAASACRYGYGFAGGGLPTSIRTAAVLPFDNQTPVVEVQSELADVMRDEFERRLGLRAAPESRADAVVRGVIVQYDADVPVAYSADPSQATTARRRLAITVDVEIVAQETGEVLWARRGLRAEGEYAERAEPTGRREAIERLVREMIEGAQSQW